MITREYKQKTKQNPKPKKSIKLLKPKKMVVSNKGVTSERIIDLNEPVKCNKRVIYNKFIADGMMRMKTIRMTPQEKMRHISCEWNKYKEQHLC